MFMIYQDMKQSKCPSMDVAHTHTHTHTHTVIMEYYTAIITNGILPLAATWMDLEGNMLSEMSLIEKDKHCMITLRH